MFTGVFCCAARQNCAQCRWPWEWPTRKDNVSFGWRRPGMTEYKVSSFVVRSHHPYLEMFFLVVFNTQCVGMMRSHSNVYIPNLCFSGLQKRVSKQFFNIFHPSWTEVVPQETCRQPPATCARGGPQWKLIDQLSMVNCFTIRFGQPQIYDMDHVKCKSYDVV